jgi:hypothetical protein
MKFGILTPAIFIEVGVYNGSMVHLNGYLHLPFQYVA